MTNTEFFDAVRLIANEDRPESARFKINTIWYPKGISEHIDNVEAFFNEYVEAEDYISHKKSTRSNYKMPFVILCNGAMFEHGYLDMLED